MGDASGNTALHLANDTAKIKILLEVATRAEQTKELLMSKTKQGNTALHLTCMANDEALVEILLNAGSSAACLKQLLMEKGEDGCTSLHNARSGAIAKLLVEAAETCGC